MIDEVVRREFGVRCELVAPDTMRARLLAWRHAARYVLYDEGGRVHVSTDVTTVDDDWAWLGFTPITAPDPERLALVFEAAPRGALGLAFIEPDPAGGYWTRALYFRVRPGKAA